MWYASASQALDLAIKCSLHCAHSSTGHFIVMKYEALLSADVVDSRNAHGRRGMKAV